METHGRGQMVLAKGAGRLKMCFDEQRMRGEGKTDGAKTQLCFA